MIEQAATDNSKEDVLRVTRTARRVVRGLAFALFILYGWLKLRGVPIGPTIGQLPAEVLVKIALVAYYFSWVYGLINDTNEQEIVYMAAPTRGRFPWQGYTIGVALALAFV